MNLKTTKLRDAIAFALVVGTAGAVAPAFAQDQGEEQSTEQAAQSPTQLDTLVVTGTRIQSQTMTASSPVAEISSEAFEMTGATRVDDLVNQYPQMSPYFDSFANNGATGYPTADLRGLGPNRTLVLVNGQRLAPGTFIARDLSQIPAALVKRVDILTGGASAVYGSDAIAGVVNFVLDTEFEGFQINYGYSAYQHDNDNEYMQNLQDEAGYPYETGDSGFDGISRNVDLVFGSQFADGRGHASAWLSWRRNEALFQGQRDYASCALNNAGTACGGSSTAAKPNFILVQANPAFDPDLDVSDTNFPYFYNDFANLDPADGSWREGADDVYNYAPINYYQRPEDKINFGSSLKYEVNEHFKPFIELMYTNRTNEIQVAESGTFYAQTLEFDCTDPLIGSMCADLGLSPTEPVTVYVGKRNVEGGPRNFLQEDDTYRAVVGSEGALGGYWSYNVAGVFAKNNGVNIGIGDFLSDRVSDALLGCPDGSFAGCIPYNVWEPGGVTPAAAQALQGVSTSIYQNTMTSVNGYVTGDLGFGFPSADGQTIAVVLGSEWRKEEISRNFDTATQEGNFTGAGGPALPLNGEIDVTELFMEAGIPVIADMGIINSFNIDLGYRRSDYSTSGTADAYKLGFSAELADFLRIRGGYNRAIRAPNISELFAQQQIALFTGADPCAGAIDSDPDTESPSLSFEECARTGVTAGQYGFIPANPASQNNQFIGGNLDLEEEQADTYTFGFAVTPIENLNIAVDYYDIKLTDRIGTIGASTILSTCASTGDPFLCSLINRNPATGDLWIGSDPATSGHVVNTTANVGELRVRGVDLNASYNWEMFGGYMNSSFVGTYVLENEIAPLAGINDDATYDCAGVINPSCQTPEWRHIANIGYSRDWYSVNVRWRYMGEMDYVDNDGEPLTTDELLVAEGGTLDGYDWFDVSANFQIGEFTDLTVGVNNILDYEPPLVGATLPLNANSPGGYDQAGRYFFTSVTFTF